MERGITDKEINNIIMVWSSIIMSSCYCYGITKLVHKGTIRFFMFMPVLCLFVLLPLYLNSINLIILTVFSVTWLTSFKLLLLVFGTGPLSYPSLSLFHFVLIFVLPIKLQQAPSLKYSPIKEKKTWNKDNLDNSNRKSYRIGLSYIAKKSLILIFFIGLLFHKDRLCRDVILFSLSNYFRMWLDVLLGMAAIMGQLLLDIEVEAPFDEPYFSTSLQDFWGRRWNRVASSSLRSTVFDPTRHLASQVVGRKWAAILALLVSFVVSELMHEIVIYYLCRVRPGWGTSLFFLVHGLCVVVESTLKRKIDAKWQLHQIIIGPLIYGFVICTFMWLFLPDLLEHNVHDKIIDEYAAMWTFIKDLGLAWGKMGYNLVVQNLRPNSIKL